MLQFSIPSSMCPSCFVFAPFGRIYIIYESYPRFSIVPSLNPFSHSPRVYFFPPVLSPTTPQLWAFLLPRKLMYLLESANILAGMDLDLRGNGLLFLAAAGIWLLPAPFGDCASVQVFSSFPPFCFPLREQESEGVENLPVGGVIIYPLLLSRSFFLVHDYIVPPSTPFVKQNLYLLCISLTAPKYCYLRPLISGKLKLFLS